MSDNEIIYRRLQIHLDEETLGFPTTKSGSDIRLLKTLFTPDQAKAATFLKQKYETLYQIYQRVKNKDLSFSELECFLDEIVIRGMIVYKKREGKKVYCLIPYLFGLVESGTRENNPEFDAANSEYIKESTFIRYFLSTKISQMRTIPIEESLTPDHQINTYDEIVTVIKECDEPIAVIPCACREGAAKNGKPCKKTSHKYTCMVLGDNVKEGLEIGSIIGIRVHDNIELNEFRIISKDEAIEVLRQNEKDGLVLQPANAKRPEFICSCCGCCCAMLNLHKQVPNPVSFWATSYYVKVNSNLCTGCRTCIDRCQVNGLIYDEEREITVVDLTRCLGCGNCISSCPNEAILLVKKKPEIIPPETIEDMNDIIMAHKKSQK